MKELTRAFAVIAALLFHGQAFAATPLVDAAWVKAHVGAPEIVFLDARGDYQRYIAAHIPGAVHTDYSRDGWLVTRDGVPAMLPKPADLEKLIGGLGIGNDNHVVVAANGTDASEMGIATRLYWSFKVAGHDNVSVLDGGMRAYLADKSNPVETKAVVPTRRLFKVSLRPELLANADDVRKALADNNAALIDHRPPQQFTGESKSGVVVRAGTIPGAANAPAIVMTEAGSGVFKSAEALKALYDKVGAKTYGDTINFCNVGHWASMGWFVSHELLGNKKARMYDGSVADWSRDANNPMQPGVAPK
jgi:thiosulfate/3-mercaptopyruvate sulfurtransferase